MKEETQKTESTLIQHKFQLGEKITTPAGPGIVTRIILELGGSLVYGVRIWMGEGEDLQPVGIEAYPEELS
jgi:hypothetical protein